MKTISILSALLLAASVQATDRTLNFNFNVKSSGADFYACNAGLKHEANQVVYYPGSNSTSSASNQVITFEDMTTDQKGEASCRQFGGRAQFVSDANMSLGSNGLVNVQLPDSSSLSEHFEILTCMFYAIKTHPTLDGNLSQQDAGINIDAFANTAANTFNSVAFDNFTVEAATCGDEHNCSVVTSNHTDDYMTSTTKTWVGNNPDAEVNTEKKTTVAGNKNFKKVSTAGWGKRVLTKVDFFLGSDLFGAEYFVDFCYRGNKINYNGFDTKLTAKAEALIKDATSYGKWAGLTAHAKVVCKTRGGDEIVEESRTAKFKGANKVATKVVKTLDNDEIKKCAIRYSFSETKKDSLRPHELTDQKVYLNAHIKEKHILKD